MSNVDMPALRRRFPSSGKGANLAQMIRIASEIGFTTRPVRVEIEELRSLQLPCILHWRMNHFVVLERVNRNRVVISDPAIGRKEIRMAELSENFTGVALELAPTHSYEKRKEVDAAPPLRELTGRIFGLNSRLFKLFFMVLALEAISLGLPLFNQLVVDTAVGSGDLDLLNVLAVGFAILIAIQSILGAFRSWTVTSMAHMINSQWTSNVFSHLLRLPPQWFENRFLGDVISRFASIRSIQSITTTSAVESVIDGIMAIFAAAIVFSYSPWFGISSIVAVCIYGIVRAILSGEHRELIGQKIILSARESSYFIETIRSIVSIKLFSAEHVRRVTWQKYFSGVQEADTAANYSTAKLNAVRTGVFGLEGLFCVWMAARMATSGESGGFTTGMIFSLFIYRGMLVNRSASLINFISELYTLPLHAARLGDIVRGEPELDSGSGSSVDAAKILPPTIEFKGVSFRYSENDPWILRDVSFFVHSQDCVALVGKSGAGKSTIVKLLTGLLTPVEGIILYGGIPIQRLGHASIRALFGVVMQDDSLLSGTIADNISFFDPDANESKIVQSALQARIAEDIQRFPMGLMTRIGEFDSKISGGQKQRLLMARALYREPKILILDEATSHLDLQTERDVAATLAVLGTTRLLVAHRPQTIEIATRVLKVEDGCVQELRPLHNFPDAKT